MVFALHELRCASCVGSETAWKEPVRYKKVQCLNTVKTDGALKEEVRHILSRLVGTNEQPNEVLSALGEVFE